MPEAVNDSTDTNKDSQTITVPTKEEAEVLYVVIGFTGEYDSYSEWMVKAFKDEAKAVAHADNANKWFKDFIAENGEEEFDNYYTGTRCKRLSYKQMTEFRHKALNPYDQSLAGYIDRQGAEYKVDQVEFEE